MKVRVSRLLMLVLVIPLMFALLYFWTKLSNNSAAFPKEFSELGMQQKLEKYKDNNTHPINPSLISRNLNGLSAYLRPVWDDMELTATDFLKSPYPKRVSSHPEIIREADQKGFFTTIQNYSDSIKIIQIETPSIDIEPYLIRTSYPITRDVSNCTDSKGLVKSGPSIKVPPQRRFQPCQANKSRGLCGVEQGWIKRDVRNTRKLWSYVAIVRDGCVSKTGDYRSYGFQVLIKRCKQTSITLPMQKPMFDEIFSISQYWGKHFGHFMTEDLPRLAPYLEYLRKNTHIKVHVARPLMFVKSWLYELGISPDRIINKLSCARVLYVPKGSQCGNSDPFHTQLLSMYARENMPILAPDERRNIVFIKRTEERAMVNRRDMYKSLKELATEHDLKVHLLSDNHPRSLSETMHIMNAAFMIFTNHGAGQSNMIVAPTGTVIFECAIYDGYANGSFNPYASLLGHKMFTYISEDCQYVEAATLMAHVKEYLSLHAFIVSNTCPL